MAGSRTSKELQIFEAMENLTKHESFDSTASFVRRFVDCNLDLNNTHQSIPEEDISHLTIPSEASSAEESCDDQSSPSFVDNGEGQNSGSEEEEEEEDEEETPLPPISKITTIQEEEENETGGEDEDEDHHNNKEVDESVESYSNSDEDDVTSAGTHDTSVTSVSKASVTKSTGALNRRGGASVYILLSEIKRSLELQEQQLDREKQSFEEQKNSEQSKLDSEKKRVDNQRKSLQRLVADYHKMKSSKNDYESQLKDLTDKLQSTKLDMSKRISRWTEQQRKLEERVKALEKENEDLKKQKSIAQRPANLKRPPMITKETFVPRPPVRRLQQPKKIHFAEDVENKPSNSNLRSSLKANRSSNSPAPEESQNENVSPATRDSKSKEDVKGAESVESLGQVEVSLNESFADKTMPSDYIEVKHPCGTITRITKDNKFTRHVLINNDIMDEFEDCSVRYYYKEQGFSQITYPNGDEIIEYDSGVLETIRADGSKIYTFSDGVVKLVDTVGVEEVYFGDGSVMKKQTNGECIITWPSGQKEIRTPSYAKRVFPNGTVKILYTDGSEETRYWNGRVRRKDKNGKLVDDTKPSRKSDQKV